MSEWTSGLPLPSREAQESTSVGSQSSSDSDTTAGRGVSLALAVLTEKLKAGALSTPELVRRIVEQAITATAAKGVALALRRPSDGAVVCCASAGDMAPPPGTVLNQTSGFTAECLRSGSLLVCEDAETDARVDPAACNRLGVRSIVAVPVEDDRHETAGILEALSDRPAAFTKKHIEALLTLACFAKSALTEAVDSIPGVAAVPVPEHRTSEAKSPPAVRINAPKRPVVDTSAIKAALRRPVVAYGAGAVVIAALFGLAIYLFVGGKTEEQASQASVQQQAPPSGVELTSRSPVPKPAAHSGQRAVVHKASSVEKINSDIEEPEITRPANGDVKPISPSSTNSSEEEAAAPTDIITPAGEPSTQLAGMLSAPTNLPALGLRVSQGAIPPKLERRVEPVYPAQAKAMRIEGPVVLRAEVNQDGTVGKVEVLKGSPLLAQAAMSAVRQWRYRPSELNHRPVASTTDVTVMFRLQ